MMGMSISWLFYDYHCVIVVRQWIGIRKEKRKRLILFVFFENEIVYRLLSRVFLDGIRQKNQNSIER